MAILLDDLVTCAIVSSFDTYLTADASGAVCLEKDKGVGSSWKIEKIDEDRYSIINAEYGTYLRFNPDFLNIIDASAKAGDHTVWRIKRNNNRCFIKTYNNRYLQANANNKLGVTMTQADSAYFWL